MLRARAVLGQPIPPASEPLSATSAFQLVGNTPLVEIRRVRDGVAPGVRLFGKLEGFNPGGSVKDRPALKMIQDGLARGALRPGKTILDSTSGNTGIALAMVGAALGYPVELVMPSNVSVERKKVVAAFGAKVIYSDPLEGSDGAILQTVTVGSEPGLPVFDGVNIWVPNNFSSSVTVVRAATGTVLATLTGNGLDRPGAGAFDGERILINNGNATTSLVSLFKAADLTPLGSFSTGFFTSPGSSCSDGLNFWIGLLSGQLARF